MARVLVVDDEEDILSVIEGTLETEGHAAVTTTDSRTAVDLAIRHQVDLVILDINMPRKTGFEVLSEMREHIQTFDLPILFLSALTDRHHRIKGLREGGDDYLVKPFDPEELLLKIDRLTARRRGGKESSNSNIQEIKNALEARQLPPGGLFFGRYHALEVIGEGAAGIVLRGRDPRLDRPVALKTLRLDALWGEKRKEEESLKKLLQEATTLARFSHPNIVAVFDAGMLGADNAFLVMELVDGCNLQEILQRRYCLSYPEMSFIGKRIASALAEAHAHELVHRDIKPGNLLIGRERGVKVTDFELSSLLASLAGSGEALYGTPGYVPPECLLSEKYSPGGDVFGLGATLYLGLTGRLAFLGPTIPAILTNTLDLDPPRPYDLDPRIPVAFSDLVMEMLDKNPEKRPEAGEVHHRLQGFGTEWENWERDVFSHKPLSSQAPAHLPDDRTRSMMIDDETLRVVLKGSHWHG